MKHSEKIRILLFGHSHMFSLKEEAESAFQEYLEIEICHVKFHLQRAITQVDSSGKPNLHQDLNKKIEWLNAGPGGSALVSVVGGNDHNILGIARHEIPFDFNYLEMPEADYGDISPLLIPVQQIREQIKSMVHMHLQSLTTIREHYRGDLIHLESPPPSGDDDYIKSNIDPFFTNADFDRESSFAPKQLRMKLWKLHSDIYRDSCIDQDIEYLEVPSKMVTPDGFLLPQGYGKDITHAGRAYANAVWENLIEETHKHNAPLQ